MEVVNAIRDALAGCAQAEIVVHEGAAHGFSQPGSPSYDPTAATAGLASLRRILFATGR